MSRTAFDLNAFRSGKPRRNGVTRTREMSRSIITRNKNDDDDNTTTTEKGQNKRGCARHETKEVAEYVKKLILELFLLISAVLNILIFSVKQLF